VIEGEILKPSVLERAFTTIHEGVDAVIHFAGLTAVGRIGGRSTLLNLIAVVRESQTAQGSCL
jgi:hypothetical protein